MYKISNIEIIGMWGNKEVIKINFDISFNFLVGQNGTGKTTIINLIAASLTGDFDYLYKKQFQVIKIGLFSKTYNDIVIQISKKLVKMDSDPTRRNKLGRGYSEELLVYEFLEPKQKNKNFPDVNQKYNLLHEYYIGKIMNPNSSDLKEKLRSFVKVVWLSINRFNEKDLLDDESNSWNEWPLKKRPISSVVEQKLIHLNNSLLRYFSTLSRKYLDKFDDFQKWAFLSVITIDDEKDHIKILVESIDVDQEKEALKSVFQELNLESNAYFDKIDIHIKKYLETADKVIKQKDLNQDDFASIYSMSQSHSLVQSYEKLQREKSQIFEARDSFINVMNELFENRKKISVSEKNEITFKNKDGNIIELSELSSGEKQLLIILGEALLQQNLDVIYIADEPELSLHVSWQENLVPAIYKLNPNVQIIFATHSPDVVGNHPSKIIHMEST